MNINKNIKLLTSINMSYIEKYLKELINICFEYSSNFMFNYSLNSFKTVCLYNINIKYNNLCNILYLINLYLEKDFFYSYLFILLNLKAKLTFNQIFQIINIKGVSSFVSRNNILLSNLYYGMNLKDFIYSSFTSRKSIIDSSLNISEAGYLTRRLIESLRDLSIKCIICHTNYMYKNVYINKYVNIPFLCLNNKSICLKCININYKSLILSGYNKGIICGQALGEPSTQMLLRTFHLGDKLAFKNVLYTLNSYSKGANIIKIKYLKYYNLLINITKFENLNKFNYNYTCKYNIVNIYNLFIVNFFYLLAIKVLNNLWTLSPILGKMYDIINGIIKFYENKNNYLLF